VFYFSMRHAEVLLTASYDISKLANHHDTEKDIFARGAIFCKSLADPHRRVCS